MEGVSSSTHREAGSSLLAAATIAFAFLAASFAATNSDLWLHLAAGRHLADGSGSFGRDPFSYLTLGHYCVNPAWLFDLASYQVFELGGGRALVAIKAFGVALLAAMMLRLSLRGNGPVWLAAGSTLLAVLAMSPRLLVQPQTLSLLLLATCLSLLSAGGRALRWLPLVFALWVNVDAWFILGLGLLVVFALSQGRAAFNRGRLVLLCFAACLLNPHHVRVFALPPELDPAVWSQFSRDPHYAGFFANPWKFTGLASWSFPVLLGLSGLSFLLKRDWRFWAWLPLAALACWQARLVPFFAVVAGPVLAINLGSAIGPNALARSGRRVVLLFAAFLLLLTWPGGLQSFSARDRALAWQVRPDPSLVRAAERIHTRKPAQVYHRNPDVAHYLAWFAPGTRGGVDSRLQLFTRLEPSFEPEYAILTVPEVEPETSIEEVAGTYVLVDRRTPLPSFHPDRLAFGLDSPRVPDTASLPSPPAWWDLAAYRQPVRTWQGDAAPTYLRLFEQLRGPQPSPALPLLAIRAARTSLAEQPRGDDVWVELARAYLFQSRSSWEAAATGEFTLVKYLRHAQIVGALQQAVIANPDNAAAHELLAGAFNERRMFDLALLHRREQLRLLKRSEDGSERVAALAQSIEQLERVVFDSENRFRVYADALGGEPLRRARIARELGLAAAALDSLEKSHPDLYGIEGLRVFLDLLLQTGRLADARVLLDRDELRSSPSSLDLFTLPGGATWRYALPAYDWLDFCQHAASGRYEQAESALERLREQLQGVSAVAMPNVRKAYLRVALAELGTNFPLNRAMVHIERETWGTNIAQTQFLSSVQGDLHTLSGLLNLERGTVEEADRHFRLALRQYGENTGSAAVHPGRPLAVRYREALRSPPP